MLWTLLYKYKIEISKMDTNTKLVFGIKNSSCINKQIIFNDNKYFIFPSYKFLSEKLNKILYIYIIKLLIILLQKLKHIIIH
jgi:hypothetical protein